MPKRYLPLIQLDLDDATYKDAIDGASPPSGPYKRRVKSVGTISRTIPLLCGLYSVSSVDAVYMNSDQEMSRRRAAGAWRGRQGTLLYGDASGSFADFAEAFTGFIDGWSFAQDETHITLVDKSLDRFNVPVTSTLKQLEPGGYPSDVPLYSQTRLIPYVSGRIQPSDSGDNAGQLPAYCIDASTFVYVAAHGGTVPVTSVYVYGVLQTVTTDYVISSLAATGGEVFTTIVFTADPRDLINHSTDEIEVTWASDDGGVETRPITLFEAFLTERGGFDAAEFDTTSSMAVEAEFTDRNYAGSVVVTNPSDTIGDVVARFLQSFGLRFFQRRNGLWAYSFAGMSADPVLDITENDIVAGSFSQRSLPSDAFASRFKVSYDYNYASPDHEFFARNPDLISSSEITNLGTDISKPMRLWFGRSLDGDPSTPLSVAAVLLSLCRESGNLVSFAIDISHFNEVDLGDVVTLTHWEGAATSGFTATRIVVLETHLTPSPTSSQFVIVGYVEPDLPSDEPTLSATFEIGGGLTVEEVTTA